MADSRRFKAPAGKHPVVVLFDNDNGAKAILETAKKVKYGKTDPYIHVAGNLYLVPTPLLSGQQQSMIEDFFDPSTLAATVDGKTFNPSDDKDSVTEFGKNVFAHKVVKANADTISFVGFTPILDNIVAAIRAHAQKPTSAATP
ncbi:MAG: hypothetical protein JO002_15540 [Burkholderiaceae bacterium]|nr:hypothetical protein [Burkholderiaceae bacterium]